MAKALSDFLKPASLRKFTKGLDLISFVAGAALISFGFLLIINLSPDYEQGNIFKLLYLHVPSSWWALGFYAVMAGCAVLGFITKIPQFHIMAKYWSIPGISMTVISLLSGMIWGKYTWGTYWVWDARLTTMFIHFMIYLGYVLLVFTNYKNDYSLYSIGSIILIIGFINLPLIKWSVDWWFTLHQPASISIAGKNAIHKTYLIPLIFNVIGFFLISFSVFIFYFRKFLKNRIRNSV